MEMNNGPGFLSPGCLSAIVVFFGIIIGVWIVGAIAANILIMIFRYEPGQIASLITFCIAIVVAVIVTRKMFWTG
jgi:hypothetical protein